MNYFKSNISAKEFIINKPKKEKVTESIMSNLAVLVEEWINHELHAFYMYEELSYFSHLKGLTGFSSMFHKQAEEELEHYEKAKEYALARNIPVNFYPVEAIKEEDKVDINTPFIQLLNVALDAENFLVDFFNNGIYTACAVNNDMGFEEIFFQFAKEQVDEVDFFQTLVDKVSQLTPETLILFDQELED